MSKNDLFLEEAVLDDLAQGFDRLEMPLSQKAFRLVGAIALFIVIIVSVRVIYLGGLRGGFYQDRAMVNAGQIDVMRPERGIIFDRFENPLVKNLPSFRLSLTLVDYLKSGPEREKTIENVVNILGVDLDSIKKLITDSDIERQNSVVLSQSLGVEQIIKIKDLNSPFLKIEDDYERSYNDGPVFSHIIGYTGPMSKDDLKKNENNADFAFNDISGKTGLELMYDEFLRGESGKTINYRNAKGEVFDKKVLNNPKIGDKLYLSIDADLQKFFAQKLKEKLSSMNKKAGVGIAMNPQTGEILSMVNLPTYDNNDIQGEDLINKDRPMFNRAIAGYYTPASTVKPLDSFAVLQEQNVSPEKKILSVGYIDVPNPYNPDKPYRYMDWKAHGWVDMYSAIARSSDVYFYEVIGGFQDIKGVGIDKLKEYWKKFGFGTKTGIDLPSEAAGALTDPETKEKNTGDIWRVGDTYNVSIGQGDLMTTPLQILNYICVFANGGKLMQPYLAKKIVSNSGAVVKEFSPKVVTDLSYAADSIKKVHQGMVDTVEKDYGTAHSLANLSVSSAAKTGSSQVSNKTKINAFFVGYAPKDDPKIAVLVLIEDASEGSLNAIPVAGQVFEWYYENRIKNNKY